MPEPSGAPTRPASSRPPKPERYSTEQWEAAWQEPRFADYASLGIVSREAFLAANNQTEALGPEREETTPWCFARANPLCLWENPPKDGQELERRIKEALAEARAQARAGTLSDEMLNEDLAELLPDSDPRKGLYQRRFVT